MVEQDVVVLNDKRWIGCGTMIINFFPEKDVLVISETNKGVWCDEVCIGVDGEGFLNLFLERIGALKH